MIPPLQFNCQDRKNASSSGFDFRDAPHYRLTLPAIALNRKGSVATFLDEFLKRFHSSCIEILQVEPKRRRVPDPLGT
jgi:hypothetical protein